jgi:hypothetical protein
MQKVEFARYVCVCVCVVVNKGEEKSVRMYVQVRPTVRTPKSWKKPSTTPYNTPTHKYTHRFPGPVVVTTNCIIEPQKVCFVCVCVCV